VNHWSEGADIAVPSPLDDVLEKQGLTFCTNFDTWKESCMLEAAEEAGMTISIQSETYNREGVNIDNGTRMKGLYIPFGVEEAVITRFWKRYDELVPAKEREIRLYKSTTLVECQPFRNQRASLFVDYHRWQYTTCSIQRRVYEELAQKGETQVPDELLNIVLSRLEYGGFKATIIKEEEEV
jgi:hypothetical protein